MSLLSGRPINKPKKKAENKFAKESKIIQPKDIKEKEPDEEEKRLVDLLFPNILLQPQDKMEREKVPKHKLSRKQLKRKQWPEADSEEQVRTN